MGQTYLSKKKKRIDGSDITGSLDGFPFSLCWDLEQWGGF